MADFALYVVVEGRDYAEKTGGATYLPQQQKQTSLAVNIKCLCQVNERNVQRLLLLTTLLLQLA
jgi:hypothetical protein